MRTHWIKDFRPPKQQKRRMDILWLLVGIGAVVCVVLYFQTSPNNKKSLYERLGGVYAIAAVVDHFSDALVKNPVVGAQSDNPFLRNWHQNQLNRLPGLKWMRTLWVCALSGGPFAYSPTKPGRCPFSLENAHKDLHISSEEFDAVADELVRSLDYFQVGPAEKKEVLGAFAAHKKDVVGTGVECPRAK
jgi:hemoglobin